MKAPRLERNEITATVIIPIRNARGGCSESKNITMANLTVQVDHRYRLSEINQNCSVSSQ